MDIVFNKNNKRTIAELDKKKIALIGALFQVLAAKTRNGFALKRGRFRQI